MYRAVIAMLNSLRDLPPLFFRLILAYGFLGSVMHKYQNFAPWVIYLDGLGVSYPIFLGILIFTFEVLGVILLFLGLFTRLISVPLICILVGAIALVHWQHGFKADEGGFELPLYYALMLFSLLISGPGRLSMDHWIVRRWKFGSSNQSGD